MLWHETARRSFVNTLPRLSFILRNTCPSAISGTLIVFSESREGVCRSVTHAYIILYSRRKEAFTVKPRRCIVLLCRADMRGTVNWEIGPQQQLLVTSNQVLLTTQCSVSPPGTNLACRLLNVELNIRIMQRPERIAQSDNSSPRSHSAAARLCL